MCKKFLWLNFVLGICLALLLTADTWATKGTVTKYSQPPGYIYAPNPTQPNQGWNVPSDIDWSRMQDPSPQGPLGWTVADDFKDEFTTPVLTVRWWGSYFGETIDPNTGDVFSGPGSEDGYVISFFNDMPISDPIPGGPAPFSKPRDLLATYVAPLPVVDIRPTGQLGWDGHEIFEYEADLMDMHLAHSRIDPDAQDQPGQPLGFFQKPKTVYWISIAAEVGHTIEVFTDTATGDTIWEEIPTGKTSGTQNPEGHFWGWHTSPKRFNDVPTVGDLTMPAGSQEWNYQNWQPIPEAHEERSMAFELLTIPEPGSFMLMFMGLAGIGCLRSRR